MNWQPMSTAPTDGTLVWVTLMCDGERLRAKDCYPYVDNAIAWADDVEPGLYTGPVEDLPEIHVDPRDAEIERLRAVAEERLRAVDDLRKKLGEAERKIQEIGETLRVGGYIDNDGNTMTYPAFTGEAVAAALKLLHASVDCGDTSNVYLRRAP